AASTYDLQMSLRSSSVLYPQLFEHKEHDPPRIRVRRAAASRPWIHNGRDIRHEPPGNGCTEVLQDRIVLVREVHRVDAPSTVGDQVAEEPGQIPCNLVRNPDVL